VSTLRSPATNSLTREDALRWLLGNDCTSENLTIAIVERLLLPASWVPKTWVNAKTIDESKIYDDAKSFAEGAFKAKTCPIHDLLKDSGKGLGVYQTLVRIAHNVDR
jgi:hypothetical protein